MGIREDGFTMTWFIIWSVLLSLSIINTVHGRSDSLLDNSHEKEMTLHRPLHLDRPKTTSSYASGGSNSNTNDDGSYGTVVGASGGANGYYTGSGGGAYGTTPAGGGGSISGGVVVGPGTNPRGGVVYGPKPGSGYEQPGYGNGVGYGYGTGGGGGGYGGVVVGGGGGMSGATGGLGGGYGGNKLGPVKRDPMKKSSDFIPRKMMINDRDNIGTNVSWILP